MSILDLQSLTTSEGSECCPAKSCASKCCGPESCLSLLCCLLGI